MAATDLAFSSSIQKRIDGIGTLSGSHLYRDHPIFVKCLIHLGQDANVLAIY
jgi:hypothetical protein